jgi:hypothetical protein
LVACSDARRLARDSGDRGASSGAYLSIALLTFNLGVEMGQLLTVAVCYGIYRLLFRNAAWLPAARTASLYAIGSLAVF